MVGEVLTVAAIVREDRSVNPRDLATLPKAHLHLHLEGAMRPDTLRELAGAAGLPVPPVTTARGFAAFIDLYVAACEVLRTPDEMYRLFREVAEDARAAGAVWVEPHVDTTLHDRRLGSHAEQLELMLDAARAAEAATGVGVGLVMAADRTLDPAIAVAQARLAASAAGRGVVTFGLANDETGRPPEPFREAFAIARAAGLVSAPHAGELEGPASIRGALDALGADRLGHGVRAVEDHELVKRLVDDGVVCDVCPTSNLVLGLYRSIDEHPVGALLEAGVRVTLNGDDPLMFGASLVDEYVLVRDAFALDDAAMAGIARTSIVASGMPEERRRAALAGVDAWLAA